MVSGEQKLFEAHMVRGAAIQVTSNLLMALADAFRPVFSAIEETAKAFAHFMKAFEKASSE